MIVYRCRICRTDYSKEDIKGTMLSPCCEAAMLAVYLPDLKEKD